MILKMNQSVKFIFKNQSLDSCSKTKVLNEVIEHMPVRDKEKEK
jgi:hypothetical protein